MKAALDLALPLIARFEGLRLRPYLCAASVPTIGYGATRYLDGRAVTLADPPISREAAERLLQLSVERDYLPAVLQLCPGADTAERVAALVSFAFNVGTGALKTSTLRKRVNAQDWPGAVEQFLKWTRAGGRILPGLTARRNAEARLLE